MKKTLTLCVILILICTAFIPTINATTVKEEYGNKITEQIPPIDSIEGKDNFISQNSNNITNFWDWFLFVFLPWFYSNFPNLFNLTLGSILLLIVVLANFIDYVLIPIWYIVGTTLGIILLILEKIFGNPVEEIDIKLSKQFLLSEMKDNLI